MRRQVTCSILKVMMEIRFQIMSKTSQMNNEALAARNRLNSAQNTFDIDLLVEQKAEEYNSM